MKSRCDDNSANKLCECPIKQMAGTIGMLFPTLCYRTSARPKMQKKRPRVSKSNNYPLQKRRNCIFEYEQDLFLASLLVTLLVFFQHLINPKKLFSDSKRFSKLLQNCALLWFNCVRNAMFALNCHCIGRLFDFNRLSFLLIPHLAIIWISVSNA